MSFLQTCPCRSSPQGDSLKLGLRENLLLQALERNHFALLFPNEQEQSEQLGPGPPTLSDNDESSLF